MASTWLRRIGLRLAPLFRPHDEDERRHIKEIATSLRRQDKHLEAQREEFKRLSAGLQEGLDATARTLARLDATLTKSMADIERWRAEITKGQRHGQAALGSELKGIRSRLTRQGAFTASVLERARRVPRQQFLEQAVLDRLSRMAASGRPIIAGPWTGEVGFELNYWAPFVRWFVRHFSVDPSRLTIVSRGGPESWYHDIGGRYVDVFQYTDSAHFAAATAGRLKQRGLSAFDTGLIRSVEQDRALSRPALLHPSSMYTLFRSFFARDGGIRQIFDHTAHQRIAAPGRAMVPGLPAEYVVAKFYFRRSFPRTPENIAFIRALLDEMSTHHTVVLLESGISVDDHEEYRNSRLSDLRSMGAHVSEQNNLDVQTAVVAGARAFVGTYGGFCYLAPLCGVPAVTFYSEPLFYLNHRYMADVVAAKLNAPPIAMLPTNASSIQRRAALDLFAASQPHI